MIMTRLAHRIVAGLFWATLAIPIVSSGPSHAQGRIAGAAFADAAWNVSGYRAPDSLAFRFRRVQFTFDNDLDSLFAIRFQLEVDESDVTSKGRSAAYLKQAWLRRSGLGMVGDLYLGLQPTPLAALAEGVWGYRSLEKTILDLNGLGAVTDMGVALQRLPTPAHSLGWHLMVMNGSGLKPENNNSKKVALSVPMRKNAWVIEGMMDFEGEPGPRDKWTAKLFAGWQKGANAFGLESFRRVNAAAGIAGVDVVPLGVSSFMRMALRDRWHAVGRVDWFDPDRKAEGAGYRELFFIAALDYMPHASVHVMPNVLVRRYARKSSADPERDTDVTVRLTLHYAYR